MTEPTTDPMDVELIERTIAYSRAFGRQADDEEAAFAVAAHARAKEITGRTPTDQAGLLLTTQFIAFRAGVLSERQRNAEQLAAKDSDLSAARERIESLTRELAQERARWDDDAIEAIAGTITDALNQCEGDVDDANAEVLSILRKLLTSPASSPSVQGMGEIDGAQWSEPPCGIPWEDHVREVIGPDHECISPSDGETEPEYDCRGCMVEAEAGIVHRVGGHTCASTDTEVER